MPDYDAIVIGAGAAGGIVAMVLAEAGKSVLLLDRGRNLAYADVGRDHLRNHRLTQYGHNTGPDPAGNPRVWVDRAGEPHVVGPHDGRWHNNAMTVGGGTRIYGAQAWRFLPDDFRMASRYGVPDGSSQADWPILYDDLAPYYDQAEWEMGVAGDPAGPPQQGRRARGYPMPPVDVTLSRRVLERGAQKLGLHTFAAPVLINTVPRDGRGACVRCGMCVGFACPTDAKNGAHNVSVPRALRTGRCELVTEAQVERIDPKSGGRSAGITYFTRDGQRHRATARAVVASCGAIESARLLLNSPTDAHPRGLGNDHDLVGRNLQGHYYPSAFGLFDEPVYDGIGPGVSVATCDFNHGNPGGIVGGAMLANDFIMVPIIFQKWAWPPDVPRWGLAAKRWMRDNFRRVFDVKGPVQEIPNPDSRVTVDPTVRDRFGIPVVRLSGEVHPETIRTATFVRDRAIDWVRASGAKQVWSRPVVPHLSGGQHQAGTCRMGTDPRTSVCDPFGRVHGTDDVFVIDGSLHVTNGGFNPVLTIMALAYRCAEHVARSI